jgi:hypothetical protein
MPPGGFFRNGRNVRLGKHKPHFARCAQIRKDFRMFRLQFEICLWRSVKINQHVANRALCLRTRYL